MKKKYMQNNVAIVVPYYHTDLNEIEKISLMQCMKIFAQYQIILLIPESLKPVELKQDCNIKYERVPDSWMDSIESYNNMMLSIDFYSKFKAYDYILLYQLDAFVFQNKLEQFCNYGYDYIGSPWLYGMKHYVNADLKLSYVGNGGFSLRKVSAFIKILKNKSVRDVKLNEDIFFSSMNSSFFKVAPIDIALKFAFERNVRQCYKKNTYELPFGCHAWGKYDFSFWKPIIERHGYLFTDEIKGDLDASTDYIHNQYIFADADIINKSLSRLFQDPNKEMFIWGAGTYGKECGWLLKKNGVAFSKYIDSDESKIGNVICDRVIEPLNILEKQKDINIIIAMKGYKNEVLLEAEKLGFQHKKNVIYLFDLLIEINYIMEKEAANYKEDM